MKLLISIYFFILAIIQMGLLFGVYHYKRSQTLVKPSPYWMASLLTSIVGLLTFGAGIITLTDIKNPEFNFTVANALFYVSAVFQVLFCQSLNQKISKRTKIVFGISLIVFFVVFEYMRLHANFELRTIFMGSLASILYALQIYILGQKRKQAPSKQLLYLQYASSAEMFFALGRIAILSSIGFTIVQVNQLPQLLILFTVSQLVMNTLSYIAIGGYWAEQIAVANVKSHTENQEIKALLLEREQLINSLLRANKTSATGALAASIAHELNQPLGASSLNIQFLQKKLADGDLHAGLQKEVLDSLLADNQRAASIIRSLRSVFADEKIDLVQVDLADLISSILKIANPEIISKRIRIEKHLEPNLILQTNRNELQQVLLNLLNNAIQALSRIERDHKEITIQARHVDQNIEITFADNGEGISAESQSHLFELLSDSKNKGMGLGLWLCRHIVTRHGGVIWFEPHPGSGAKFLLQLPIKPNLPI
jgi:signal transduction histidine kinase